MASRERRIGPSLIRTTGTVGPGVARLIPGEDGLRRDVTVLSTQRAEEREGPMLVSLSNVTVLVARAWALPGGRAHDLAP